MVPSCQKTSADTWGALLKVHAALVPRLDRALQEAHGVPLTWYDVLLELSSAPEHRLTMGRLGVGRCGEPHPGQPGGR